MSDRYIDQEDDGRVVADMSEVSRTPILIPRFDQIRKNRPDISDGPEPGSERRQETVQLDGEGRRAMIAGALSAALLIGGTIAAAFAILIFFILKVYG
ncbi:MAG: hypothetical protein IJH43_00235 [Mogibacterium sp.]|nr:hypothetical protein [Mogibacterium sp.]